MRDLRRLVVSTSLFCSIGVGCGSATAPSSDVESEIQLLIVSGDGQSGPVAKELPKPVVVQVLLKNRPVAGKVVNFVVTTASDMSTPAPDGGAAAASDLSFRGRVFAGTAITDSKGKAQDFWTLGTRTLYPQTLEVRAADLTAGKQVYATFKATALPAAPYSISPPYKFPYPPPFPRDGGSSPSDGGSSSPSSSTQQALVLDMFNNPVPNFSVAFAVTSGGGTVTPAVPKTGADGIASVVWTYGSAQNMYNILTATATGLQGSPLLFNSYVPCTSGSACVWGNGVCVNTQSDPNNCGWCSHSCGQGAACLNGSCQCSGGVDGGSQPTLCWDYRTGGNYCADLQTDNNNCGWCGSVCPAATQCVGGSCQCPGGTSDGGSINLCGDTCVDLQNDPSNCGWCGNQCGAGSSCVNGTCQCPDGDGGGGQTRCHNWMSNTWYCADTQTDNNNCGSCGSQCGSGATCMNGTCQCDGGAGDGGAGLTSCRDWASNTWYCADTQTDNNNCGWCGNACPTGTECANGGCQCLTSGRSICNDHCVDLQNDNNNCGSCGNRCPSVSSCISGSCRCANGSGTACPVGNSVVCVDLQNDKNNCGGCSRTCPADPNFLCRQGSCVFCPPGQIYCGDAGYCVDPRYDSRHCGGCGNVCSKPGSSCTEGRCGCPADDCGSYCANLSSDPDHCGDCDTSCEVGTRVCSGGACHPCSVLGTGYVECGGTCVDTLHDSNNCGGCGTACGANAVCISGGCVSGQ